MDARTDHRLTQWLEVLAESEAELAAGLVVSGDEVMRELRETLARLEGKALAVSPPDGDAPR
jgi:hypothetical protein